MSDALRQRLEDFRPVLRLQYQRFRLNSRFQRRFDASDVIEVTMTKAYEQLGDFPRAVKCYKRVTAFENHPLTPDARDALDRLQARS